MVKLYDSNVRNIFTDSLVNKLDWDKMENNTKIYFVLNIDSRFIAEIYMYAY